MPLSWDMVCASQQLLSPLPPSVSMTAALLVPQYPRRTEKCLANISSLWRFLLAGLATAFTAACYVSGFSSRTAAGSWLALGMAAGYGPVDSGGSRVF